MTARRLNQSVAIIRQAPIAGILIHFDKMRRVHGTID
jgi:hypothetical protein